MRLRTLIKVLALGLAARAVIRHQRDRRATSRRGDPPRNPYAADPSDPVQSFDEAYDLQAEPLEVDAQSRDDIEAAQDLAGLEIEVDRIVGEDEAQVEMISVDDLAVVREGGEIYGGHTPAAVDRMHADDDEAFASGQNWVEALETSAIENGAEPERELSDLVDDDDLFHAPPSDLVEDDDLFHAPHASATRDTPIADYGSGGRRGL